MTQDHEEFLYYTHPAIVPFIPDGNIPSYEIAVTLLDEVTVSPEESIAAMVLEELRRDTSAQKIGEDIARGYNNQSNGSQYELFGVGLRNGLIGKSFAAGGNGSESYTKGFNLGVEMARADYEIKRNTPAIPPAYS